MDQKYLPSVKQRKQTLLTQIAEAQQIIYRNLIEVPGFEADGQKSKLKEVEINNNTLIEKLDILYGLLAELEKEEE